jgi:hypothetical protein
MTLTGSSFVDYGTGASTVKSNYVSDLDVYLKSIKTYYKTSCAATIDNDDGTTSMIMQDYGSSCKVPTWVKHYCENDTSTIDIKHNWFDWPEYRDFSVACRVRENDPLTWTVHNKPIPPLSVRLKEVIAKRQGPAIIIPNNDRKLLTMSEDVREQRARETLRRVIGDEKYRDFLRNGFISVRAKSGLNFQIFPGHGITCVFSEGKMVERLCVVMRGNFPPTDSLIMRYLMILNNETQFRSYAIKHNVF